MAWLNVEQSAPTLQPLISRLFRTSEDGQGSLLPSHCTRCACSRPRMPLFYTLLLLRMNGELRRSLIRGIRPTNSLFYGRDLSLGLGNVALVRLISHRKVGGVPRSWAAGSSHHDRLKGKSHRDIGSNPIHDSG